MSHPPRPQAPPPGCYYSAYSGAIATNAKGNFANFILSPDECHRKNGYWVFPTVEDQRRAHARGLRNPEAILCAADLGDNPQPDINLSWRRGSVDRNITGILTGNAAQHLMEIYDMRRHLGKTLSFGGQIPRYPVDIRLKAWWECRRAASRPATSQTPIDAAASLASPSAFAVAALGSPSFQADFRRSSSSSHQSAQYVPRSSSSGSANDRAYIVAAHNTLKPHQVHFRSSLPPFFAADLTIQQNPGRQPTHNGSYQQSTGINTRTQSPAKISGVTSESRSQSPYAFQVPGFAQPAPSGQVYRTMHANGHAKVAYRDNILKQMGQSHQIMADPIPHLSRSGPEPIVPQCSKASQQIDGPEISMVLDAEAADAYSLPKTSAAVQPIPVAYDMNRALRSSHTVSLASPCIAMNSSGLPDIDHEPQPRNACLPQGSDISNTHQKRTFPISNRITRTQSVGNTNRSSPNGDISTSQSKEGERLNSHASRPSISSLSNGRTISSRPDPESRMSQPPVEQVTTPQTPSKSLRKRSVALTEDATRPHKKPKVIDHPMSQVDISDQNYPSPIAHGVVEKNTDMYLDLPCMDCGEDVGHKSDCHIGHLKPATNLSVLDYRKFSELTERFDPGPWTTHEVPAVSPSEDSEIAILGMADVIRNELSYKGDTELHPLPDAAMIMLWAFKTSPNIEILE